MTEDEESKVLEYEKAIELNLSDPHEPNHLNSELYKLTRYLTSEA